jgi:hypothetical protein
MRRLLLCSSFLLLVGCAPSVESCRRDAEATQLAMRRLLSEVQTQQQLKAALPKLRRHYLELARLMVAVERAYDRDEWLYSEKMESCSEISEELRGELVRLYQLPNGRDLMEEAQEDALRLLERRLPGRGSPGNHRNGVNHPQI